MEEEIQMTKVQHLINVLENKLVNLEDELTDLIAKIEAMEPSRQRDLLNLDRAELIDQIDYVWQDLMILKKEEIKNNL